MIATPLSPIIHWLTILLSIHIGSSPVQENTHQLACNFIPNQFDSLKLNSQFAESPENRGKIKQKEISGITYSHKYPGYFWGINDGGNGEILYLYKLKDAQLMHLFILKGITNKDWEDLTIGKSMTGKNVLYIGDIGDNQGQRKNYTIYEIEEPNSKQTDERIINLTPRTNKIRYQYEDGPRDAESIMFDPISKCLYVISKREDNVGIYQIPTTPSDSIHTIKKIASLPISSVVAADFSKDGMSFILKTYNSIYLWKRTSASQSFCEMISSKPEIAPYVIEPQGEAICFITDGYITVSEESLFISSKLFVYPKK